jgi:hypothetical protein
MSSDSFAVEIESDGAVEVGAKSPNVRLLEASEYIGARMVVNIASAN